MNTESLNIISKLTWQFNIAIIGAVFAVFSIIYEPQFIYYGFITFLYGVIAHVLDLAFHHLWIKDKKPYWLLFTFQFVLIGGWIYLILCVNQALAT